MKQDRRHSPRLENNATTTWRFRQLNGDRLRRGRCLALVNDRAVSVDNADMGLLHRDIEASKIVHWTVSSSESLPILSSYPEELRPLPDVEKVACRDAALLIHFSRLQVGKDQMNPSQKIGFTESMN
jgi:hypothetical protein